MCCCMPVPVLKVKSAARRETKIHSAPFGSAQVVKPPVKPP